MNDGNDGRGDKGRRSAERKNNHGAATGGRTTSNFVATSSSKLEGVAVCG